MIDLIWEATLDNQYKCQVIRLNEVHGQLSVVDNKTDNKLLERPVTLSYGARFGPDVDDLYYWQELCVETVDKETK